MAYTRRYAGGFVDLPATTTAIDSTFLNAVEAALLKLFDTDPIADGQVLQWINASTKYGPALILNKNVDAAAGIVKSKLDFSGANGIVNADIAAAAAIARSKLDFGSGLVNADIAAAAAIVTSKLNIPYGTSLPGTPADKDIAVLVDSTSAPTYQWIFRYNSGSASSYKWELIGGSDSYAEVKTSQALGSTGAWIDLATVGPSLTAPRAGDYDIYFEATLNVTTNPMATAPKLGSAAVDADDSASVSVSSAGEQHVVHRKIRRTLAASDFVKLQYNGGSTSNTAARRVLRFIPVRVS